jgi:hypothetical protein
MSSDPVRDDNIRNDPRERPEMPRLLSSNHLNGMAVFDRKGEKIGTIHSFMIDRMTGRVALAVMSLGGFLGMGGSYHPLPWPLLAHAEGKDGFIIDLDDAISRAARPSPAGRNRTSTSATSTASGIITASARRRAGSLDTSRRERAHAPASGRRSVTLS